ncbi:MAG: acylphosphatase [Methanothrix sp.]|nr:acylphosphatase [Methanothrix sp.]
MKLQAKILGHKVHEVGYRVFLLHKAIELSCQQFSAYNRFQNGLQMVLALVEGDEDQLDLFKCFVKENNPEGAEVTDMYFEEYHGYVMSVENFMRVSMVEQLNKGIPALLRIDRKQDRMLEKQDATIAKLEETRADIVSEIRASREEVISKLDENREAIIGEIGEQSMTHYDRLKRIESDILKLKAKVGI